MALLLSTQSTIRANPHGNILVTRINIMLTVEKQNGEEKEGWHSLTLSPMSELHYSALTKPSVDNNSSCSPQHIRSLLPLLQKAPRNYTCRLHHSQPLHLQKSHLDCPDLHCLYSSHLSSIHLISVLS